MLIDIYQHIGNSFKGKMLHLKCDCIVSLDIKGRCVDFEKKSNELVLLIDVNGKIIPVGCNTPKLKVEII